MIEQLKSLLKEQQTEKIRQMIEEHPEVLDQQDENGTSGLLLLAYSGYQEIFASIIVLKKQFTFYEAIVCGKMQEVQDSVANDPSLLNRHSADGFTPLSLAAYFDQMDIARWLLQSGADPNQQATNPSRVNALHSAVARENYELCNMLISHGAEVNLPQAQKITALHSAAHRGNLALVKLLIENGADPNAQMENGATPLAMTNRENHEEVWRYLQQSHRR